MANPSVLGVSIAKLITGLILVGLFSYSYNRSSSALSSPSFFPANDNQAAAKAALFAPILAGLIVTLAGGVLGIAAAMSGSSLIEMLYLIGAAVTLTASAALIYGCSLNLDTVLKICEIPGSCPEVDRRLLSSEVAFSVIAFLLSCLGLALISIQLRRKLQ